VLLQGFTDRLTSRLYTCVPVRRSQLTPQLVLRLRGGAKKRKKKTYTYVELPTPPMALRGVPSDARAGMSCSKVAHAIPARPRRSSTSARRSRCPSSRCALSTRRATPRRIDATAACPCLQDGSRSPVLQGRLGRQDQASASRVPAGQLRRRHLHVDAPYVGAAVDTLTRQTTASTAARCVDRCCVQQR